MIGGRGEFIRIYSYNDTKPGPLQTERQTAAAAEQIYRRELQMIGPQFVAHFDCLWLIGIKSIGLGFSVGADSTNRPSAHYSPLKYPHNAVTSGRVI